MTTTKQSASRRPISRRLLPFAVVIALGASSGAAFAQNTAVEQTLQRLTSEGYVIEEVRRTLLGRIRIEAVLGGIEREIVIDPRNGVILRDYIDEDDDESGSGSGASGGGQESASGGGSSGDGGGPGGGDDDDDDGDSNDNDGDDGDDDDDDDEGDDGGDDE